MAAIFPKLQWSWLAFVCLIPLFCLLSESFSPFSIAKLFYLSGVVFHLGNLYWIYHVIQHYTSLAPVLAAGILVLLCLTLSLFWGLCGWILGWISVRFGMERALLAAPFCWILVAEKAKFLIQFPWDLLGYSQINHLAIAQFGSLAGVFGLSWLIVFVNSGVTLRLVTKKNYYWICGLVLVVAVAFYGRAQLAQPITGTTVKTGVIQGNVPQDVKEDSQFAQQVNDNNLAMTRKLIAEDKPDIVFWSESSTLFPLRSGGEWTAAIITAARETSVPLLIGSDSYTQDGKVYNSAFLINPEGQITQEYSKIYLVPFGEFVPFHQVLFFAGKMVPEISDFSPGTSYTEFPLRDDHFALNICFEVVFPQLARRLVNGGASLLVTITNDAWFGNTAAPYQHFDMAAMRAIENRRYLVRSANTGVSGVVDPYGRMLLQTPIFQQAAFAADVKLIHDQTFYTKYGDWILYLGALALLILLVNPSRNSGN